MRRQIPAIAISVAFVFFILLFGCIGGAPAAQKNATANNSNASSAANVSRILELQNQLSRLLDEESRNAGNISAIQARIVNDTASVQSNIYLGLPAKTDKLVGDYGDMMAAVTYSRDMLQNASALTEEICRLNNTDCSAQIGKIRQTISCANASIDFFKDAKETVPFVAEFGVCQQNCNQLRSYICPECSSSWQHIKANCNQSSIPTISKIQSYCRGLGPDYDTFADKAQMVKNQCLAIENYSIASDNSSVDEPVTPPAVIITPSITGEAVVDPTNGTFTTHSCYGITAQPAVIKAGKESALHFRGYAANSEAITYTCGDEVRSNGNGGLIDFTRICRYTSPGHYAVWLALDGFVCASTPLEVEPAYAVSLEPACTIAANSQNEERNGTATAYSAKVMLYNQPGRAQVEWDCGQTHFNRSVGSAFDPAGSNAAGSLISGALMVSCHFDTWPPPSPGRVSIGGSDCGPMVISP